MNTLKPSAYWENSIPALPLLLHVRLIKNDSTGFPVQRASNQYLFKDQTDRPYGFFTEIVTIEVYSTTTSSPLWISFSLFTCGPTGGP